MTGAVAAAPAHEDALRCAEQLGESRGHRSDKTGTPDRGIIEHDRPGTCIRETSGRDRLTADFPLRDPQSLGTGLPKRHG